MSIPITIPNIIIDFYLITVGFLPNLLFNLLSFHTCYLMC